MNKVLFCLPISDVQLLLAASRRVEELSKSSAFVEPEALQVPVEILLGVLKEMEDGLSAYYSAKGVPPSARV